MSEILGLLPEASAVVGYMAGQVLEQVSLNRIGRNRQELFPAYAADNASNDDLPKSINTLTVRQGFLNRSLATLALIGALAGFANGEAWKPNRGEAPTADPSVLLIPDHSFATAQDGSHKRIDAVTGAIASQNLKVKIIVAHNGSHNTIAAEDLPKDRPYGPVSLEAAVSAATDSALNGAKSVKSEKSHDAKDHVATNLVVVTDDNSIGSVNSALQQSGGLPIYIANVGANNDRTARDLQAIARQTGGQYWHVDNNVGAIAQTINHVSSHEHGQAQQPQNNEDNGLRDALKILGFGLLALGARQFRRRKSETAIS